MPIISHSKPTTGSLEARAVADVVRSGQLTQGKHTVQFERHLARAVGLRGGVAVSSGSAALHLALLALGVEAGDEVVIPTYVCTALLNAVQMCGAHVQLADVDPVDGNISVPSVQRLKNARTKVVIVPHMFGRMADIKAVKALKIPVIEDCAQAIGARRDGVKAGASGKLSVFSFYATKMLSTGEGGMVTSDQVRLLDRVRDFKDYDHKPRFCPRYNYKMTDMQAAMGRVQLTRLKSFIAQRRKIAQVYDQCFDGVAGLTCPPSSAGQVYFRYVIQTRVGAAKLIKSLRTKGIMASSPVYKPLHCYLGQKGFPGAEQLVSSGVSLPIYPSLTLKQARSIAEAVQSIHA